jgi:hypothetical protein
MRKILGGIKAPMNPFSKMFLIFGQILAIMFFFTLEHFSIGFKSKVQNLQRKRSERFQDFKNRQ